MAMYRDVEHGFGVLDPILHVFLGGFQLPALTTFSASAANTGSFSAWSFSVAPVYYSGSYSLRRLVTTIYGCRLVIELSPAESRAGRDNAMSNKAANFGSDPGFQ